MKSIKHNFVMWWGVLILVFVANACHYKIKSVNKEFVNEDSAVQREALVRKKIASRPYVYILAQGDVFMLEEAVFVKGLLKGKLSRVSKWMDPIRRKTQKEKLPAELEAHQHFDEMVYLEVEGRVREGDFELDWQRLKSFTFYK